MPRFSLVPYSIRVKRRRTTQYIPLSDIPGYSSTNGVDLLELLHHYLNVVVLCSPHNPDHDEILRSDVIKKDKRWVCGRLKAGERGYGSDLIDTQTGNTDYRRTKLHAEIIPYYFLTAIPPKSDKGIIILQKFKNRGIKDLFFNSFYDYFKGLFGDDYTLEMNPLVPMGLIKEYLQGRILKVRLIKQGFSRDTFDIDPDAFPDDEEYKGKMQLVLEAEKNGYLPRVIRSKLLNGIDRFLSSSDEPIGSVIEVKNFDFDNIKIEVQVGRSEKTIDLSNLHRLRYFDDISGIDTDSEGHPKFDIIDERAKAFLQDLAIGVFGGKIDV